MSDEIHVHREDESGVRGGAAAAYAGTYAQPVERGLYLKDRVRWASVWGGYVVAFALQIWLTAIGFAIFAPGLNNAPATTGTAIGIWAGVAALIALFVGGYLASKLGGIAGTDNGIFNGVVLWGLSFVILALISFMLSSMVGAAATSNPAVTSPGPAGGAATPGPGTTSNILSAAASGGWWFVIFQFLGLIVAAIGGAVGARKYTEEELRAVEAR